ncbi:MAG: DnaB-like helicase C-terminal domain-containing protein, partial [Candidatus Marinimicrobia bacterium]|nr:DnaB-like helicase C-terminal domain-containing protein [Candidatus Neomarinimicrobiota bacterium]
WPKISKAAGILSETPIFIDDTAGLDILGLRSRIRRFKADHAVELVIIDYLQLISGRSRMENRQQEMSDITRSLKGLARELDITILALSQLSRAPEQRPGKDKRPIMSDLRESGAIEQDADVILFLYRPILYTRSEDDEGKAELIIAKQRNGPTGTVHLTFEAIYTKFENASFRDDLEFAGEETPF